ncbi:MAG: hypothetical protein AAFW65_04090 [Pseudomonadota bacterium]
MKSVKRIAAAVLVGALPACSSLPELAPGQLLGSLDDDAVGLNEIYTNSNASVIALNVLRSRDRVLRSYTSMSGLTATPSGTTTGTLELKPLGLGNPKTPFGESGATAERAVGSELEYSVNPFAEADGPVGLFRPTSSETFKSFWDRGWPKDVLAPLFIRSFKETSTGKPLDYWKTDNEATIDDTWGKLMACLRESSCTATYHEEVELNELTSEVSHNDGMLVTCKPDEADACCEVFEPNWIGSLAPAASSLSRSISAIESSSGKTFRVLNGQPMLCPETKVTNVITYRYDNQSSVTHLLDVQLRSFDGMIYFLGETMRNANKAPETSEAISSAPKVPLKPNCEENKTPEFFRLWPEVDDSEAKYSYSVQVEYRGEDYFGVPYSTKLGDTDTYKCAADRTGLVMSILMQLYLLNQSPEFLKAPNGNDDQ